MSVLHNRFIPTPIRLALALAAVSTLVSIFPKLAFLCTLLVLITLSIWLIRGIFELVVDLMRSRRSIARNRIIAIVISAPLFAVAARSGDYLHLAIFYPSYRQAIGQNADTPVRFDWGDQAIWVTDGIQMHTLIYDRTDTTAGRIGIKRNDEEGLSILTRRLVGNFFIEYTYSD